MERPILYLLAGNGSAADWWDDVLPCFHRYCPVPLELPGFGDNQAEPCRDLAGYAQALLAATIPGTAILAVGINALPVLHALQREPGHFSRTILLSPVGAFLWQRRLPAIMAWRPLRRMVHWLLSHRPNWFARKFSVKRWRPAQYRRMGAGYRRCRAFQPYWDIMRADKALALLEWIADPIDIIWGGKDNVIPPAQAAAWSAILARADLTFDLAKDWGHYPWIDDPAGFAARIDAMARGVPAHSKAGRLFLARLAGLPVPAAITVRSRDEPGLRDFLAGQEGALFAVRSSSAQEDQADAANAGLSVTFLRRGANDVPACVAELCAAGVREILVQCYVAPLRSGIAFVRHLAAEIEWVDGHLESLADGTAQPRRVTLSRLGGGWSTGRLEENGDTFQHALWGFLQTVLRAFHYVPGDIEWAWEGRQFWLLQYRPVTSYGWRRHLTAANIAEILPPQPSRLVEYAQRRAAGSIPAVMARWDSRVLKDNEPFSALFDEASYINNDLFLARLRDWGLSSRRYASEVGGGVPIFSAHIGRCLLSLPVFYRMQRESRLALLSLEDGLQRFDDELSLLIGNRATGLQLAQWFTRFYLFIVQGNLCIATAVASAGGGLLGVPATVYAELRQAPHRMPWETDPATPRCDPDTVQQRLTLQPFPLWPAFVKMAHRLGFPGMRGYYLQVREWYRDNLMRVFFRLHHAFQPHDRDDWFAPHAHPRNRQGGFWQDGTEEANAADEFVIYPGSAEGLLGSEILLVDSLDPGRYEEFRAARAVITRLGGRLSHGATLLRELRKPSAVIPAVSPDWIGQRVLYADGVLRLI